MRGALGVMLSVVREDPSGRRKTRPRSVVRGIWVKREFSKEIIMGVGMRKKWTMMLMAVAVLVATLAAQPAYAGEGAAQTQRAGMAENCSPGAVSGGR